MAAAHDVKNPWRRIGARGKYVAARGFAGITGNCGAGCQRNTCQRSQQNRHPGISGTHHCSKMNRRRVTASARKRDRFLVWRSIATIRSCGNVTLIRTDFGARFRTSTRNTTAARVSGSATIASSDDGPRTDSRSCNIPCRSKSLRLRGRRLLQRPRGRHAAGKVIGRHAITPPSIRTASRNCRPFQSEGLAVTRPGRAGCLNRRRASPTLTHH